MKNHIYIINATAAKHGGALTILKDYLSEVRKMDNGTIYYIFTGADLHDLLCDKIKLIKIKTHGFGIGGIKRLYWDFFGFFMYCKWNRLNPDLIISFQNTGVIFPKVKQLIYYHQPIPLYDYRWKFYIKDESALFFYKYIYPFFIKMLSNSNSHFVVQTNYIKKLFIKKFQTPSNRVNVIIPGISFLPEYKDSNVYIDKNHYNIFYPTNHAKYKNFDILFDAISQIKKMHPEMFEKIMLHITLDADKLNTKSRLACFEITNKINFLGCLPRRDIFSYYKSVDLLVFPSYIETFGLPLIEAAHLGVPILASDLYYAHEALQNYKGVKYVEFDNSERWADAIIEHYSVNRTFEPLEIVSGINSWVKFIELAEIISSRNLSVQN